MDDLHSFNKKVEQALADIDSDVLDYHEDEFWMIRSSYEYLEFYSKKHQLVNTAIALPLSRGLHNGTYRKLPIIRSGVPHNPPYIIHCLAVAKMLADMWLPISPKEKDILLAAALCHDTIEDIHFKDGGRELYLEYHLDKEVYDTVLLVTKRHDFSLDEEKNHFKNIMENRLALLIKLSDRGHNVSDLYNMSEKKIREYIGETRAYILPMCEYSREHYPELNEVIEIMQDQLICLTKTVEKISEKYNDFFKAQSKKLQQLREENKSLIAKLDTVRKEALHEG